MLVDVSIRNAHDPGMALGPLIGDQARRRRLSQAEAAAYFGVTQQTFSRWCTGQSRPADEHRTRLAHWLGLSLRDYDALWIGASRGQVDTQRRLDALERKIDDLTTLVLNELAQRRPPQR